MSHSRLLWLSLVCLTGLSWALPSEAPRVVSDVEYQLAQKQFGPLAVKRLQAWQELIDDAQNKPERLKLSLTNDFFNQSRFVDDKVLWHKDDYWASPFEFLTRDAGDCEDFVIAKYFTLKALGVDEGKIYLTYVKSTRLKQSHMVLTYFQTPKTEPLVLDNLTDRILKASQRPDLIPIYSFNGAGLWLSKQRGKGQMVEGGADRIEQWNNLLKKLQK